MRSIPVFILMIYCTFLFAQKNGKDLIYLKNGQIIRGTILKQIPDSLVTIKTNDGRIAVYKEKTVEKFFIYQDTVAPKTRIPNNLWMGIDAEPQFQDVVRKKKDVPNTYPDKPGFSGGFWLYWQAPKTIGFETGLQYHFYQSEVYYASGPILDYDLKKYHNLEIPVLLNLHTNGDKIRFYTAVGFVGGVTLAGKEHYHVQDAGYIRDTTTRFRADSSTTFYGSFNARAGIELNVNKNMLLKIGASFSMSAETVLGPGELYSGYLVLPYSIGLNVALLFRMGKQKPTKGP
ncbi:MAG: hypothetical protein ACHQIM_20395 [Sphingobacteriales bacterium]